MPGIATGMDPDRKYVDTQSCGRDIKKPLASLVIFGMNFMYSVHF